MNKESTFDQFMTLTLMGLLILAWAINILLTVNDVYVAMNTKNLHFFKSSLANTHSLTNDTKTCIHGIYTGKLNYS